MKNMFKLSLLLVLSTHLGCQNKTSHGCEKFMEAHDCGKSNLPDKSHQQINDWCSTLSPEQRNIIISCIEQNNYCDLYNKSKYDEAIKVSIDCTKKVKSSI